MWKGKEFQEFEVDVEMADFFQKLKTGMENNSARYQYVSTPGTWTN